MAQVFITGCPGAGKSTLARRLAEETGAKHIYLDGLKKVLRKTPHLRPWVDFYGAQDEERYWQAYNDEEHFAHVVLQSEVLWPRMRAVIERFQKEHKALIVDGANALPHLMHADFSMKGVVLLPPSQEAFAARLGKEPRWSKEAHVQWIEAERYRAESQWYAKSAEAHGCKIFHDSEEAFHYLASILMAEKSYML